MPALLLAGAAHAQDHVLKVDIFQPIINTLALSYEHKLSESSSFQLGLAGTFAYKEDYSFGNYYSNYDGRKTSGFAITPEYRLYLSEKHSAMEGFYVAPFLRFQYLNQTGNTYTLDPSTGTPNGTIQQYEASLKSLGIGAVVGRHWIFKQRFSLDLYAGPAYTFSSVSQDSNTGYDITKGDFVGYLDGTNYDLRGGVTFGVAF